MPWCPKCKNEYREGVKRCSDCGCELVETESSVERITFGEREEMEELAEFLGFSGLSTVQLTDSEEQVCELSVDKREEAKANKLVAVFVQQKQQEAQSGAAEQEKTAAAPYEDSAAKAEDNRSSAYTLLIVGVVGMLVIVLGLAGALPIHLTGSSMYMTYGMMSVLFLLFIVMGVISMKSYHFFAKRAASETSLRDTMEKWCLETLAAEQLDAELFSEGETLSEEEKYFQRIRLLKKKISEKFLNLDEAFLDRFTDEIYGDIFEE